MKNIAKALVAARKEIKGVEKSLNVGTGGSSYKGVADKVVKDAIRPILDKHGLSILPTDVVGKSIESSWEESGSYGNKPYKKTKFRVFTEVHTKYLLLHDSGESIELAGYGHGVDSQDKGAGKATTYALKYTLLYGFLVSTGKIDDSDNTHSDDVDVPNPDTDLDDLLDEEPVEMITVAQVEEIEKLVKSRGRTMEEVYRNGKIKSLDEIDTVRAAKLIKSLKSLPKATLK